jgi:hypothetical protein
MLLLAVVLLEQEVQFVEVRPRGLPMRLAVQIAQRHGVREQTIECGHAAVAHVVREAQTHGGEATESLDDERLLGMQERVVVHGGAALGTCPIVEPALATGISLLG